MRLPAQIGERVTFGWLYFIDANVDLVLDHLGSSRGDGVARLLESVVSAITNVETPSMSCSDLVTMQQLSRKLVVNHNDYKFRAYTAVQNTSIHPADETGPRMVIV